MANQLTKSTIRPAVKVKDLEEKNNFVVFETPYFELKWKRKGLEDFGAKLQKLVDARKDWPATLYAKIAAKMKYISVKDVGLDLTKIDYEETILAFAEDMKKRVKLREVPIQKTIPETIKKGWHPKKFKLGGERAGASDE